ncbi:MAG: purine-nucleoside phosphorylase [Oscillospiraceae bacterium]|nr:purine-nucleoside phosphorylase [Oscillospiraceae bacterium]
MTLRTRIEESTAYLQQKLGDRLPKVGMILGSGLGGYADKLEDAIQIPYGEIPGFLQSTVEGHRGQLVVGKRGGHTIVAMQGRFHYYEGYSQQEITIPVRVMKKLGIETLIITNAAGGIKPQFIEPLVKLQGVLMVISDHINYSGQNPLIGGNLDEFGPRFPAMNHAYDETLRRKLIAKAAEEGIMLDEGVYAMYSGPNYETPAEIRFLRTVGADAVGMSTVPEVLVATHCGMRVLGISCITNVAAGLVKTPPEHKEVDDMGKRMAPVFTRVLDIALSEILD